MRLQEEQMRIVEELYNQDRDDRAKSFKTFHKQYAKVPESDFVRYWLLNKYRCNQNESQNQDQKQERATPSRKSRARDLRYSLCADA